MNKSMRSVKVLSSRDLKRAMCLVCRIGTFIDKHTVELATFFLPVIDLGPSETVSLNSVRVDQITQ